MTLVYVQTDFVGFHCWVDAPDEVSFLRALHRHKFGVKVTVVVNHADRQVEFFLLQRDVRQLLQTVVTPTLHRQPGMSCEMMGQLIFDGLMARKYTPHSVEVNEDSENGAIISV